MPWPDAASPGKLAHRSGVMLAGLLIAMPWQLLANGVECELGTEIIGGLGDGVTMRTCSWEKSPGIFVRTGPLQLVKNGVLILQLQTDRQGRLQGRYTAWNDAGVMVEEGSYRDGLKEGEWQVSDDDGSRKILHYRAGVPFDP